MRGNHFELPERAKTPPVVLRGWTTDGLFPRAREFYSPVPFVISWATLTGQYAGSVTGFESTSNQTLTVTVPICPIGNPMMFTRTWCIALRVNGNSVLLNSVSSGQRTCVTWTNSFPISCSVASHREKTAHACGVTASFGTSIFLLPMREALMFCISTIRLALFESSTMIFSQTTRVRSLGIALPTLVFARLQSLVH